MRTVFCRRMFPKRGVVLLVTATAAIVAGQLRADIVTLVDNGNGTGSITVPDFYNLTSGGPCSPSGMYLTCTSSNGPVGLQSFATFAAPVASTVVPSKIYIGDPSGNISDEIATSVMPPTSCDLSTLPAGSTCAQYFLVQNIQFTFGLDRTGPPTSCSTVVGGCLAYNGLIQDVGTVVYGPEPEPLTIFAPSSNLTLDFRYTPEPGLFAPLALGLVLTGFAVRKKARARRG
jgi:hypothetical protein